MIPRPLTKGHLCKDCAGTGANIKKTLARPEWESGYVRCHTCNGNGLDPAKYFSWKAARQIRARLGERV